MTYTTVKRSDGTSVIVSNTVKNTAGADIVVSNDVLDTDTDAHTIFSATVPVNPIKIVHFKLTNNRYFRL